MLKNDEGGVPPPVFKPVPLLDDEDEYPDVVEAFEPFPPPHARPSLSTARLPNPIAKPAAGAKPFDMLIAVCLRPRAGFPVGERERRRFAGEDDRKGACRSCDEEDKVGDKDSDDVDDLAAVVVQAASRPRMLLPVV